METRLHKSKLLLDPTSVVIMSFKMAPIPLEWQLLLVASHPKSVAVSHYDG